MSEEKTFVFPEGNGSIDPNLWAALNNNGGMGGGMWNNPIWAIVFLAFLRGGFWGGDGNNTGFVSSQLGQAIAGNANAISNLATNLNCSIGQVQSAISNVQTNIQQLANQTGMSSMQVINAINSGDAALTNAIQSASCQMTNTINTNFGNLRYENAAETNDVKQAISNQTATVIAKLDAIEDARKDREIAALTAANATLLAKAEREAELAPIYKAIEKIPNTVPVQWPQLTAVPTSQLYGYGPYYQGGTIWS